MVRVFLDADVLFSAAYRADSGLVRLWEMPRCTLITSHYAAEEAMRNLDTEDQRQRLAALLARLTMTVDMLAVPPPIIPDLPAKDQPILLGALAANADYLLTGDIKHFGSLPGTAVGSLRILTPAQFLRSAP